MWSGMSVDEKRGLVFLPVGSTSYDFYGADRKGTNLFSNSLVALDAASGKLVWYFQMVHHDIWDYDMGETRMPFTAVSPDDPTLGKLDFDQAYSNSLSGVLANHVYNSLLTGRPYFFDMIEDAEIATQFAKEKLGRNVTAVTAMGANGTLASAISEVLPGIKFLEPADAKVLRWSDLVEQKQEVWPIQFLVPGGAYIH